MTQTALEQYPGSLHAVLVTARWGDANVARYVRSSVDVVSDGDTFSAAPSIKVLMDKPQQGGTDDSEVVLQISSRHTPFDKLAMPYAFQKADIVIEEITPGVDATRQEIFTGRITQVVARPSSTDGVVKCTIKGIKRRFGATLGLQANTSCCNQFGNENNSSCGINLLAHTYYGTITTIDAGGVANRITTSLAGPPLFTNALWNRGYIEVDGLRIMIRASLGAGAFELRQIPPPSWAGEVCKAIHGCDKSILVCRSVYNNEQNFAGYGYSLPERNPIFEE